MTTSSKDGYRDLFGLHFFQDRLVLLVALFVAFVVYGSELTSFTLSIDEELRFLDAEKPWHGDHWKAWIAQGRWGMGLLNLIIPPINSIPFLATLLFLSTLSLSAIWAAGLLNLKRAPAIIFAGTLISFPVWPHIAEFNTLSWGFGIGFLAICAATALLRSARLTSALLAAALVAFALAVYQSLLLAYGVLLTTLLIRFDAFWPWTGEATRGFASGTLFRNAAISVIGGAAIYVLTQKGLLFLLGIDPSYISHYIKIDLLISDPWKAFARFSERLAGGSHIHGLFLGWGFLGLALPAIGLTTGTALALFSRKQPAWQRVFGMFILAGLIAAVFMLSVISAGFAPIRTMVALPLVVALFAAISLRVPNILHGIIWLLFALTLIVNAWVSTSLFYADQLARQRDELMATRIIDRVDTAIAVAAQDVSKIAFIGQWKPEAKGIALRKEIFGISVFAHDAGHPVRMYAYLVRLGLGGVRLVPNEQVGSLVKSVTDVPSWPHPDSVKVVDETAVVKLAEPTQRQRQEWNIED